MQKQLMLMFMTIALSLLGKLAAIESVTGDRQAVLRLITACANDPRSTLSGQNVGHAGDRLREGYQRFVSALVDRTGEVPAILSVDYGYNEIPHDLQTANELLIKHWHAGGLVMISMHPANPWTRDDCHDLSHGEFDDLFNPGTAVQIVWSAKLDRIARGLQQLQRAGVVVLWRPFHEMNGGWFWWGSHQDGRWLPAEDFRKLWRETFRYLSVEKQLDNLLWVYSPAVHHGDAEKPVTHYYPGDEMVDIVALDWYTDRPKWSTVRSSVQEIAKTGKPIGLAEFGPRHQRQGEYDNRRLLDCLQDSSSSLAFFNYWHSWQGAKVAIVDNRQARALMQHPNTVNRAEAARRLSRRSKESN